MRPSARFYGVLLFSLGAVATIAPLFSSVWGVAIVGAAIFLSGIVELADAWFSGNTRTHFSSGVLSVLAGALISMQSAFAFSGLMVLMSLVLALDGGVNVLRAVRGASDGPPSLESYGPPSPDGFRGTSRVWDLINGSANILLAILVWTLRDWIGPLGFGVLLGLRMAASGWQTMFAPSPSDADTFARIEDRHPDRRLRLPPIQSSGSSIARPGPTHAPARPPISTGA